jgi:putative membrane protein
MIAMSRIGAVLVVLVIALHLGFMTMEMMFWDHEIGRRIFSLTPEFSAASKVLAANQGLYNGLLAAGLGFALVCANRQMLLFLLGSVVVAGLYGGFSVKPTIFLVQALPAALAFVALVFSGKK